jgi:hypothetical protein
LYALIAQAEMELGKMVQELRQDRGAVLPPIASIGHIEMMRQERVQLFRQ